MTWQGWKNCPFDFDKRISSVFAGVFSTGVFLPDGFLQSFMGRKLQPNDILGMEYIKALWYWKSPMRAESILRKQAGYYEENKEEAVAGATLIRKKYKRGGVFPIFGYRRKFRKPFAFWEDFYPYLRYSLLLHRRTLSEIQDMEEGLENRMMKAAEKYRDYFRFGSCYDKALYLCKNTENFDTYFIRNYKNKQTDGKKKFPI